MMDSLAGLAVDEPDADGGDPSVDGGGAAATDSPDFAALLGVGGLGSTSAATAGAGKEAALAQALLAAYGASDGTAATGTGAVTGSAAAAAPAAASGDARSNAAVVADVARQQGVDPVTAVAMMLVESGGNAGAVGDGGSSFGLFQLHEGGMLTAAGLTPQQAFDPRTNATVSIRSLAHEWQKGPGRTPGEIAAASQRPADPAGYAARVNATMDRARALLAGG
ncbi:MAG: hypothetical protein JWM98_2346 [Thermoleophilia bacterium]|nr:hypothetical protein [Thermoleophilia bacterium]